MNLSSLAFDRASYSASTGRAHFDEVSVDFPLNEIVLIEGDAGSGKSLLLKAMAGLVLPVSGSYLMNGVDVSRLSFKDFLPYRLAMGYSFEHGGLIGDRSVYDNLILPLQYHRIIDEAAAAQRVEGLLEAFSLREVRDEHPAELASSFRRRAVVARSLIMEPELLLLDHPTTGLSDADREQLADLIKAQRAMGKLRHVFIVSRQKAFIDQVVTCRIHTANGRIE